jgi:hypothetical protein
MDAAVTRLARARCGGEERQRTVGGCESTPLCPHTRAPTPTPTYTTIQIPWQGLSDQDSPVHQDEIPTSGSTRDDWAVLGSH